MTAPSRIKEIPESELTAEQATVFKDLVAGRGALLTPYKIWIHSPKLAAALENVGTFLNKQSSLTEREIELAVCIIANHWSGEYVWTQHVRRFPRLGFSQAVIDAIRAGEIPALDDERERAVCELARSAMQPGAGPDDVFDRAAQLLGRDGIAEVLALLGYYSSVAMAVKLHRVPVPT